MNRYKVKFLASIKPSAVEISTAFPNEKFLIRANDEGVVIEVEQYGESFYMALFEVECKLKRIDDLEIKSMSVVRQTSAKSS